MSDVPKRRFWIWSICLLIVVVSAPIVFVIRVARQPSEPFISVSVVRTNMYERFGFPDKFIIEVSNKMSFNVNYWIEEQMLPSAEWISWGGHSLAGHSQNRLGYPAPTEGFRICVLYQRQLKPIEKTVLDKMPWLKKHYPFIRLRCSSIYDVQVSSETKQQPQGFKIIMKTLLAITAAASLLVGCATSSVHHAEQWEYQVKHFPPTNDNPTNQIAKASESFLNDMGKDGWIFIEKDEAGWHYFKRVKR